MKVRIRFSPKSKSKSKSKSMSMSFVILIGFVILNSEAVAETNKAIPAAAAASGVVSGTAHGTASGAAPAVTSGAVSRETASISQSRDFSDVQCPEPRDLAKELLEREVSGFRTRGSKASCLAPEKFPHLQWLRATEEDGIFAGQPQFVDEKMPFEIRSVENYEGVSWEYEVQFVYNVIDKQEHKSQIKGSMILSVNRGPSKAKWGCGDMRVPPGIHVIRRRCYHK